MPVMKRFKTDYVGVYYIMGASIGRGRPEKIFYITYRHDGKLIEEKAGRQFQDAMTPARASRIRAERIEGKSLSNKARREKKAKEKLIQEWTIKRLWTEYIETKPKTKSFIIDDQRFRNHMEPVLGNKKLEDLAPLDLDRLRIKLLKEKAPQTVKSILALLKRISNFAKNKRLCKGIDFKIIMPKVSNQKTEFLTDDQVKGLLDAIEKDINPYAGSIMLTALYTGMRKGEILRLEWRDIDFEHGFIHIREPKSGQDQKIPLNDAAREVFKKLPRTHKLLFPGIHGLRTGLYHAIGEIKKKAGLPADFRPLHGLRHHYASMLASSGKVDMYVLQKLLTHKTPTMTQRYAHLRDETLKEASQLAGELISQALEQASEVKLLVKERISGK
ncbi:MAG: site-specific integrase [Thermodesulfobacteriota bacterium]|jgi:integrase